jgi:hypothetical protein
MERALKREAGLTVVSVLVVLDMSLSLVHGYGLHYRDCKYREIRTSQAR